MPLGFIAEGLFVSENKGMSGYVERLIKCGYEPEKAQEILLDYLRNFTIGELEVHVRYLEDVGGMESKPDREKGW